MTEMEKCKEYIRSHLSVERARRALREAEERLRKAEDEILPAIRRAGRVAVGRRTLEYYERRVTSPRYSEAFVEALRRLPPAEADNLKARLAVEWTSYSVRAGVRVL